MKRIVSICICFCMIFVASFSLTSCNDLDYKNAIKLLDEGKYEEARDIFFALGDYKDSAEYLANFYYVPTSMNLNLAGRVATFEFTFNSSNLIAKISSVNEGVVEAESAFSYDEHGDMVHVKITKGDFTETYNYAFLKDGMFATSVYENSDGYMLYHSLIYNENGDLSTQFCWDNAGSFYEAYYYYNESGELVSQKVQYFAGYSSVYYISYIYDENGRLVKEVCDYEEGYQESLEYSYDANGRLIKKTLISYDGSQSFYEYAYDVNGNRISKTLTDSEGTVQTITTEYKLVYIPCGVTYGTKDFFTQFFDNIL